MIELVQILEVIFVNVGTYLFISASFLIRPKKDSGYGAFLIVFEIGL